MGVVMLAHDPQLDRRVALKVLRPGYWGSDRNGRRRLLREAQAMAALSHPNVVKVLDVGTVGRDVFIAMEYIRGRTLRDLLAAEEPTWAELVELFRAAGRGLAAAHRAGLVHRDFKPENVMLDDSGKVVVLDLGLARAARTTQRGNEATPESTDEPSSSGGDDSLTATGSVMGTPAYMAPEQHRGIVLPESDQFALCAALYEALYRKRPFAGGDILSLARAKTRGQLRAIPRDSDVPRHVRRTLVRGLDPDPGRRFSSMDELVARLDPSVATDRRRVMYSLGGLALVGSLMAAGFVVPSDHDCSPKATAWDDDARDRVRSAFADSELPYVEQTTATVVTKLDAYSDAIVRGRESVCRATYVDRSADETELDLRTACLDRRDHELAAIVEVLGAANAKVLERAAGAVRAMSPVDACHDLERLAADVPEPESPNDRRTLARLEGRLHLATARIRTGAYAEARDSLLALRSEAQRLGHDPFTAEVHLRLGDVMGLLNEFTVAQHELETAAAMATESRHDRVAANAHRMLAWNLGHSQAQPEAASHHLDAADAFVERLGRPTEMTSELLRVRAVLAHDSGDFEGARRRFDEGREQLVAAGLPVPAALLANSARTLTSLGARADAEALLEQAAALIDAESGPDHPRAAKVYTQLAQLHVDEGEFEEARGLHERALKIRQRSLGENHRLVAFSYNNLAGIHMYMGAPAKARDYYDRARAILSTLMGADHPDVGRMTLNIADLYKEEQDWRAAELEYDRGIRILESALGEDHPHVAHGHNNLGALRYDRGDYDRSAISYRRALAILERALGPRHADLAYPLVGLAQAEAGRGHHKLAIPPLERALALREGRKDVDPYDLADVRYALARSLDASGSDRGRAIVLGKQAIAAYEADESGRSTPLEEANAWLAELTP